MDRKAVTHRKDDPAKILAALSYDDLEVFRAQWDLRLESWRADVRELAVKWREGREAKQRVYKILEDALKILSQCEPTAASMVSEKTYGGISQECSILITGAANGKLYRSSNKSTVPRGRESRDEFPGFYESF